MGAQQLSLFVQTCHNLLNQVSFLSIVIGSKMKLEARTTVYGKMKSPDLANNQTPRGTISTSLHPSSAISFPQQTVEIKKHHTPPYNNK
jgi:hypothetical protein